MEGRILVSADTELNWLHQFKKLTGPNHQIIGVPVYEDGASCGKYMGRTHILISINRKELPMVYYQVGEGVSCPWQKLLLKEGLRRD